jgi:ferredoxin
MGFNSMKKNNVYRKLAKHLKFLGMGYPPNEALILILEKNVSPVEAEIMLGIPNRTIPLQPVSVGEIAGSCNRSTEETKNILEGLACRGMIYSGKTEEGEIGYALLQIGYGFPQVFFWKGEDTDHAREMAKLSPRFLNLKATEEIFGTPTKSYRFVPINKAMDVKLQAVYPYQVMEKIVENAKTIAVAHCVCRVRNNLIGNVCSHPLEVCMKYDELAEYLIERGMAREIDHEEALKLLKLCNETGLVHFVDNAIDDIKHNCNCCGCSCWAVSKIRKRELPRDMIMATYFIRETEDEDCTGCGDCVEVCPVECLSLESNDIIQVDKNWCIGCGVCIEKCSSEAAKLILRPDKKDEIPETNFRKLQEKILEERGFKD